MISGMICQLVLVIRRQIAAGRYVEVCELHGGIVPDHQGVALLCNNIEPATLPVPVKENYSQASFFVSAING